MEKYLDIGIVLTVYNRFKKTRAIFILVLKIIHIMKILKCLGIIAKLQMGYILIYVHNQFIETF